MRIRCVRTSVAQSTLCRPLKAARLRRADGEGTRVSCNFDVTRKLYCAAMTLRKGRNLHNFPDQPPLQTARAHGEVGCRIGLVNRVSHPSRGVATAFAGVVIAILRCPRLQRTRIEVRENRDSRCAGVVEMKLRSNQPLRCLSRWSVCRSR
jgi:hypothetical protein